MSLKRQVTHITSYASRPVFIALFLFLAAALPRLVGLNLFLTTDESYFIAHAGSEVIKAFLQGNLRGTYWHFYPGVTLSWLTGIGLSGQYLYLMLTGQNLPSFIQYLDRDVLSLLVAARLPFVLLTAMAVPAIYLLARRLLPESAARLGALFLAFDPFYLAHSRVVHGDGPTTVFMSMSVLAFFVYLRRIGGPANQQTHSQFTIHNSSFIILSAIFGGLAALTKTPGPFMALFVAGLSVVSAIIELRHNPIRDIQSTLFISRRWLMIIMCWGLVALAVFVLLWPSMWVDPLGTVRQMWDETFYKVEAGHLVYFFGQATLDPGFWFYPYVIPFRLTPVILLGSLLSLVPLARQFLSKRSKISSPLDQSAILLLWLFTISLFLFGMLSPKKQDRYLLPLFPFLDLLAAVGWLVLFDLIVAVSRRYIRITVNSSRFILPLSSLLLLLLHFYPVITDSPYYLAYFNPLLGGLPRAVETTLVGWGEGMEQVAAYLNTRPNARNLYVASTPSQTLLPYFVGTGENFYTNDIAFRADYVVLYVTQLQRLAPSPDIVHYFEAQTPEKVITIKGVTYAKIYHNQKLILPAMPADATPVNVGLGNVIRLAGYKAQPGQLTLYWHALAPLTTDYTISVRARAADGRWLAQHDSWPVNGLLPTSQWRQGDYVADTHTLALSEADLAQINDFEVVVYNLSDGVTLGPPLILRMRDTCACAQCGCKG